MTSPSEKSSLAFREVTVIPKVGRSMPFPLRQSLTDSDLCFRDASEFPSERTLHRHYGQLMAC